MRQVVRYYRTEITITVVIVLLIAHVMGPAAALGFVVIHLACAVEIPVHPALTLEATT